MTKLGTVLFFVALCSTWDRVKGTLFAARDRNYCKHTVKKVSFSWRLRRHGADEAMTKLGTVLCFVPLKSTWDRLNGRAFAARDRNSFKLIAQWGSISLRLRRQGIDEVMMELGTELISSRCV